MQKNMIFFSSFGRNINGREEHMDCVPIWQLLSQASFWSLLILFLPESHPEDQQVSRGPSSQLKRSEWNLLIRGMWRRQKEIQKWSKRSLAQLSKWDKIHVFWGTFLFLTKEEEMPFFYIWKSNFQNVCCPKISLTGKAHKCSKRAQQRLATRLFGCCCVWRHIATTTTKLWN